jgi:alpha-beta hydrolase superfamily lysophospholipase
MLRWFEHSQVYHPDRLLIANGGELGRPFENLLLKTSDGIGIHAWFFSADQSSPRKGLVLLVCHGNAGNISHRLSLARALLQTGVNVFLFDYRGFGQSEGTPTEEGTYLDAQAAHHWLTQQGYSPTNIILFGESLGGGIASELAVREKIGGLILQSTFSCIPDVGAELFPWLPVRWMASIHYNTCEKLPRITVPVLVMHSRMDALIRFRHAEKNFARANEPKLMWELQGDHNESVVDEQHFVAGVEKFLRMIEGK